MRLRPLPSYQDEGDASVPSLPLFLPRPYGYPPAPTGDVPVPGYPVRVDLPGGG